MNADGTNQTQWTNSGLDRSPRWSPDSSRIAVDSIRDGNPDIYVTNADGGNVQRLTNNSGFDLLPKWSPDGTKIAFVSSRDDPNPSACGNCNSEIYVMNADGSNQTRLTNNPGSDGFPRWSPDGTRIVFQSSRDAGNFEIYVMNADGTNQTRLTNNQSDDHLWPIFSPDGTRIASTSGYTFSGELLSGQISVMNADGSNPVRLTNTNVGGDATGRRYRRLPPTH